MIAIGVLLARQNARPLGVTLAATVYFRWQKVSKHLSVSDMRTLTIGCLRVSAVVERAGPTRPTWLLPDAVPEAVERHRSWLAPHFLDDQGRFLQSIHSFVIRAPGLTALVDTCVGNDKDRGGRQPFHMMRTPFLDDLAFAGFPPESIDLVLCTHLHVSSTRTFITRQPGGSSVTARRGASS